MLNTPYILDAPFAEIAEAFDTPTYVYDHGRIADNYGRLRRAFGPDAHMCYAVKANSNLALLRLLHELGAGFDVVSAGEMRRALLAGADPAQIVFAGVGKRDDELAAAIEAGVGWINVESVQELRVLSDIAVARGRVQRVAIRINPSVDAPTHAYLATAKAGSKFGVELGEALELARTIADYPGVALRGVHFHIGSSISDAAPFLSAVSIALESVAAFRQAGAQITMLDIGGGYGIAYQLGQEPANLDAIGPAAVAMARGADVELHFEPGRYIIGDAGVLLTRVLYTKQNGGVRYGIVDAAMNDLIRPALYQAKHRVSKVHPVHSPSGAAQDETPITITIAGPVCESGDILAHAVPLPELARGDLLVLRDAGAYGMAMASNYNSRPRPAEVLVKPDGRFELIRRRETLDQLLAPEVL